MQFYFSKISKIPGSHYVDIYKIALDLLQNTNCDPTVKENPDNSSELFYRFYGIAITKERFIVQVKADKKTKQKWFMSVSPSKD